MFVLNVELCTILRARLWLCSQHLKAKHFICKLRQLCARSGTEWALLAMRAAMGLSSPFRLTVHVEDSLEGATIRKHDIAANSVRVTV